MCEGHRHVHSLLWQRHEAQGLHLNGSRFMHVPHNVISAMWQRHVSITVAILAQGTTHGPMRSRRPFDRGVHNAAIMFSKKIRSLPALRTDECRLRVLESFFPRLVVQPAAHMLSSGQFGHTCEKLCALVTLPPLLAQIGNDQARTTLGPPPCFHEMENEKAWILPAAIPRRMHRISSELRS